MNHALTTACIAAAIGWTPSLLAAEFIDLAGPATGFAALSNAKNSTTQNGIEGKDASGNFDPLHNGLPEYPNYQLANGNYTAIIAGPQSTTSDYSAFAAFGSGFSGSSFQVNNQNITQSDFSTLSSGRIDYDDSTLVNGSGVVPVSALTFDFNTFAWDGTITPDQTGDPRSNWTVDPVNISPLSPVQTPFNDGSGAGNAQFYHLISISNVTGDGLTFVNGELTEMDFIGDVTVNTFVAPFAGLGSLEYTGTLTGGSLGDPLSYVFDVSGTDSAGIFGGVNFILNRSGTASLVVPEPTGLALLVACALSVLPVQRRRR
ncbi:MAG: hypothetical protein AAF797_04995 [Planctomycetota bacterium]